MAGLPRKHHYVPEVLIKRFCSLPHRVFYFDNLKPWKGIEERSPTSVFHERRLYTRTHADGRRDVELELAYGKLETTIGPILAEISGASLRHHAPLLTAQQRMTWFSFLYEQMRRVPEFFRTIATPEFVGGTIAQSIEELEAMIGRPIDAAARALSADSSFRESVQQKSMVTALSAQNLFILDVLRKRQIAVLIATGSLEFVLGSRPVVKLTKPGHTRLDDLEVELWLPIGPRLAVGMGDGRNPTSLFELNDRAVAHLNRCVVQQSSKLVAATKEAIELALQAAANANL